MTRSRSPWRRWVRPQTFVAVLLAAWALGLGIATLRLQVWQQDVTRVLVQLRADALLGASVGGRDQVRPDWYRRRALELLSAVERLRENSTWALVMPGSWRMVDDLEARAAARIDSAFGQRVVLTIHRELETRAAAVTGATLNASTGELVAESACTAAPPAPGEPAARPLPERAEFASAQRLLQEARQLDLAVRTLSALRSPVDAAPEDVRSLVRYTLGADVSTLTPRSLAYFQSGQSEAQAQRTAARLRIALGCSMRHSLQRLHARAIAQHELLALEDSLSRLAPATLFDPAATGEAGVVRVQAAMNLIEREQQVIARGLEPWMAPNGTLAPAHQALLHQVAEVGLLGPELARELEADAQASRAAFRNRLEAHMRRPDAGLAWQGDGRRLALSTERNALRRGLLRLLEEPYMSPSPPSARQVVLGTPAQQALQEHFAELLDHRRRFMREGLASFPVRWRPSVQRFVDERVAQDAFDAAVSFVAASLPPERAPVQAVPLSLPFAASTPASLPPVIALESPVPIDTVVAQRIAAVERTALEAGAPTVAARLRTRLEREVLAPLQAAWPAPYGTSTMGAPPAE